MCVIHVRDYLNWIHDIQDKTPCIALTLFKHENGRVKITKGPLNPLLTDFQKLDQSLATHMTKPSYDAQTPFRCERPKLETQATEKLYKDAPPGILMIILY